MFTQKSGVALVAAVLLSLGLSTYGMYSTRSRLEERIGSVQQELLADRERNDARIQEFTTKLDDITQNLDYAQRLSANYVDKDRIRGYLSTPKDRTISAEGPTLRK